MFVRSRRAADRHSGARIWRKRALGARRRLLAGSPAIPAGPPPCFWREGGAVGSTLLPLLSFCCGHPRSTSAAVSPQPFGRSRAGSASGFFKLWKGEASGEVR
jgi:hypothetical protein